MQGATGHGFPIAASGLFEIANWATTLPEDLNAGFLQVFIVRKADVEANVRGDRQ